MRYSVIIRNRNEEKYIGHCIQSVIDFLGDDVQIVLVDNESTDNSIRIVNTFDYLNIEYLTIGKNLYSPGRSLNMGINKCDGDITIIISAHCEIIKWSKIESWDDNLGSIWGKQIPIWDGKKVTPRYLWSNFGDEGKVNYWCNSENRYFLHNAFSIFNTEHLKKYSFDERLSGKEDRYWANDQIEKGYDIVYNPNFIVKHYYTINSATWKGVG
jgi:glycosyltransferase involved in cell wall biosynthesis